MPAIAGFWLETPDSFSIPYSQQVYQSPWNQGLKPLLSFIGH